MVGFQSKAGIWVSGKITNLLDVTNGEFLPYSEYRSAMQENSIFTSLDRLSTNHSKKKKRYGNITCIYRGLDSISHNFDYSH